MQHSASNNYQNNPKHYKKHQPSNKNTQNSQSDQNNQPFTIFSF